MLINTIEQLRNFVPVSENFPFEDIGPSIKFVEQDVLIPLISKELYDILNTAASASSPDPEPANLLPYAQRIVANGAIINWSKIGDKHLSKSGIAVSETTDLKMAAQWRLTDMREDLARQADNGIENLLEYLEANIATFTQYRDSEARKNNRARFITSAKEFQQIYNIQHSHRSYRALLGVMKNVEELHIKSITGKGLFDKIKSELSGNSPLPSATKNVLDIIKPCVAYLSISRGLKENMLTIRDGALMASATSQFQTLNVEAPPTADRIQALAELTEADGKAYQERLRKFLYENHATYPEYESDTSVYVTTDKQINPNTPDSGIYFL